MILLQGLFSICVDFEGNGEKSELIVNPLKEHFNIISEKRVIASLRNVDKGVWEQIEGNLDQKQIALITDSIDNRYSYLYKN